MAAQDYDLIFLGGGPAGYQGAIRAAQLGLRVAVIEDTDLGGVCLNQGCIPTKAIRASAEILYQARQAKDYGIVISEARPDMNAIINRKNRIVTLLREEIANLFAANKITLYNGRGKFVSPREIRINESGPVVKGSKIVITTGSRPKLPAAFANPIPGVVTSQAMLDVDILPETLLIIGGGIVGLEIASIAAALGSQVTVLEEREQMLPKEDRETVAYLEGLMKSQGIKLINAATEVEAGTQTKDGVTVSLANGDTHAAQLVVLAAGRLPNTTDIGLENTGLDYAGGFIPVNEHMETEVKNIFAAGDVVGGWLLAHVAFMEGIIVAEHAAGLPSSMDYRVVPRCLFTFPEYASVGLSEEEAQRLHPAQAFTYPLQSHGMAQALGAAEGMVKLVVHTMTGEILGGHVIGPHASELVSEIALAMRNKVMPSGIINTIHIHPTMAEAVLEVAQASSRKSIHSMPRS
ncbi:MAG: dihydrolipoyl dehydrogenase [Syntrophomonadaceae bacterium]|nr:dihydrolipoyl dehydrogenase [Syntrophomonadaceae bacterium]